MSQLINRARQVIGAITSARNFDRNAKPLELVSIQENGNAIFQWKVDETLVNGYNTLHGGYTAFAVDFATSAALMVMGHKRPGVSIELSISYLKAAKINEIVTLETECKKLGSTLAFMEATLKNSDGELLATAKHIKHVGESLRKIHVDTP